MVRQVRGARARILAWTILPLACAIGCAQGTSPAAREISAFRESYSRIELTCTDRSAAPAKTVAQAFDAVVLALLNGGVSMERIGAKLPALPGSDFSTTSKVTGADVVAGWPEYKSRFSLFSLGGAVVPTWAAVSNFGDGGCSVGHLAVFEQSETSWRRIDGFDSENRLHVYAVGGLPIPTLAVIDHWDGADGWTGSFQLWQLTNGRLSKVGRQYEPLHFYEVQRGPEGPKVNFSEFTKCLGVSVSQLSLSTFELTVETVGGAPQVRTRTTAPWVVAVDEACSAVRARRDVSIDEPVRASALRALRPDHVILWDAEGDEKSGKGWVSVTPDTEKFFRFEVDRNADGTWRIVKVAETTAH